MIAHDVFISYASEDKPSADAVCGVLEARGIRCWIAPRDILPGADWSGAIVDAIEAARVMVLLFSANANASRQIIHEVERAVNKGLTIIPFRIEDVVPGRNLEYFLSTPHWLDALTPPLEQHLQYLADTVAFLLERGERPEPVVLPARPVVTVDRRLIAGAAAVLVVLVAAYFVLGRGGGSAPPVEAAMLGPWQIDSALGNGSDGSSVDWTITVAKDGGYSGHLTFLDSGTVAYQPAYFLLNLTPAKAPAGSIRPVDWHQNGDTATVLTAALVPSMMLNFMAASLEQTGTGAYMTSRTDWHRTSGAGTGQVGHWERDDKVGSLSWHMTLDITADGHYSFQGVTDDAGKIYASKGKWRKVSNNVGLDNGDYQVVDANTIVFKDAAAFAYGPTAQVTWHRIQPKKP